jgi:hypothetical protein
MINGTAQKAAASAGKWRRRVICKPNEIIVS